MYSGNFVFSQIMDHLSWPVSHQCVAHYSGDKYIKTLGITCESTQVEVRAWQMPSGEWV